LRPALIAGVGMLAIVYFFELNLEPDNGVAAADAADVGVRMFGIR